MTEFAEPPRMLRAGDILAPRARAWTDVLIQEVRPTNQGRLGLSTIFENGLPASSPTLAWTQPPTDVAVMPDLSDFGEHESARLARHRLIGNAVAKVVADAGKAIELGAVVAQVSQMLGVDPLAVEDAIRFRVGTKFFEIEVKARRKTKTPAKTEPPIYLLSVPTKNLVLEKRRRYAASLATELEAQSRQIADLIEHRGTTGTYRETLFRRLLERHLP